MEQIQENKMGTMPINRLLFTMSMPVIISMLVLAMYNIVDSIFVARLNEEALTAVSMAFPIQNLMISVGAGTGVGINALLSRSLGERNFEQANKAAGNGIFLVLISSILFALFGLFFSEYYFTSQINDTQIIKYGTSYLKICTILSIGIFMQMTMERLLQSTGKTFYTMITQIAGAIVNIILDPILIFGLFGLPRMEVAGAALATIIGQLVAMSLAFYLNVTKNKEISIRLKGFRPHIKTIASIYSVGVPAIIMQAISSILLLGINRILLMFTPTAVSVFGVHFRLQSFIFMPLFGLNMGMIPIIAYNYGANHRKRVIDTIKLSHIAAFIIMITGVIIFQIFPKELLGMFKATDQMIEIGIPALRIISICFICAGFCIITISVLQAFGEGMSTLIISAVRQLVVILPVAYIFAKQFGLYAVWWAFPIAEIASVTLCIIFFLSLYKKKIKQLGE